MTRIFVGAGRAGGVRPKDLVGAIAGETSLSGKEIGAIEIAERFSAGRGPRGARSTRCCGPCGAPRSRAARRRCVASAPTRAELRRCPSPPTPRPATSWLACPRATFELRPPSRSATARTLRAWDAADELLLHRSGRRRPRARAPGGQPISAPGPRSCSTTRSAHWRVALADRSPTSVVVDSYCSRVGAAPRTWNATGVDPTPSTLSRRSTTSDELRPAISLLVRVRPRSLALLEHQLRVGGAAAGRRTTSWSAPR